MQMEEGKMARVVIEWGHMNSNVEDVLPLPDEATARRYMSDIESCQKYCTLVKRTITTSDWEPIY
jgi:hypothetical protein